MLTNRTKHFGATNRGYVVMVLTIIFASIALILVVGGAVPIISHYSSIRGNTYSKQSFLTAGSAIDEALYRLRTGKNLPGTLTVDLGSSSAVVTTTATPTGKRIIVNAEENNYERNFKIDLLFGTGISFFYGVQSGNGGFVMRNSSSVTGNVFSNGPVIGDGNYVYGSVVSAGPSGLIDDVHATGTALAHTINDSIVDKDAYYTVLTDTTVAGTKYPNSVDQAPAPMPISDADIADWKSFASTGGPVTCTDGVYTITTYETMGPKVIPCDLMVKGNEAKLTMTGPIWVQGNITTQTGPIIAMDPGLGSTNMALIADNPSNPTGSGIITIGQNSQFLGSGAPGSFVFAISQNTSAETGGSINAIDMGQSAGALVTYASHGQVTLGQSVGIKEVTAYKIILINTANVKYDTGLPSVLFSDGPGGSYDILSWTEL